MHVLISWLIAAAPSLILPLQLLLWRSYRVVFWICQRNNGHLVAAVIPVIVKEIFFSVVPGTGPLRAAFHCFDKPLWQILRGKILPMLLESLLIFEHENRSLLLLGGDNDQLTSGFCHVHCPVYCFHLIVVAAGPETNVDERTLEEWVFHLCSIAT